MSAETPLPRARNTVPTFDELMAGRVHGDRSHLDGIRKVCINYWKEAVFGRMHGDERAYRDAYPSSTPTTEAFQRRVAIAIEGHIKKGAGVPGEGRVHEHQ
jgi:hypothetical protein